MAGNDGRLSCPDRAHHGVERLGRRRRRRPPRSTSCHAPPVVVEARLGHLASEADALAQPELLGHALEVGQQVGLGREARHPVVGLREGEAVELVGHVDPAAGVHVLEPGAADVVVLLEDGDRRRRPGGAGAPRPGPRRRRRSRHNGTTPRRPAGATSAAAGRCRAAPAPRRGTPPTGRSRPSPTRKPKTCRALVGRQLVVGCARRGVGAPARRRRGDGPRPPARA